MDSACAYNLCISVYLDVSIYTSNVSIYTSNVYLYQYIYKYLPRYNKQMDPYTTLQIKSTASAIEIKSAYKKLVLKYHPDRNKSPSAPEKFRQVQMAYDILSNNITKNKYDSLHGSNFLSQLFVGYQTIITEICHK